jgi:RimK family alpha-L-glutamate ligase
MYFQIIASGNGKNSLSRKIFDYLINSDHECEIFILKEKGFYSNLIYQKEVQSGECGNLPQKIGWVHHPTTFLSPSRHPEICLVRGVGTHIIPHVFYRLDFMSILEEVGVRLVNTRRCMELATNKMLTTTLLHKHHILSPESIIAETSSLAMEGFYELGRDVVLKPLYGARGKDIIRINFEKNAKFVFDQLESLQEIFYLQKYYEHKNEDYRLFVVDGKVIASMKRKSKSWKTNISTGGLAEKYTPSEEMIELAIKSTNIVNGEIAGVDLMETEKGLMVIEVNAVPGYQGIQSVNPTIDIPKIIGEYLIKEAKK